MQVRIKIGRSDVLSGEMADVQAAEKTERMLLCGK